MLGYVRTPKGDGPMHTEVVCPALTLRSSPQVRPRAILHFERRAIVDAIGPCPRVTAASKPPMSLRACLAPTSEFAGVKSLDGDLELTAATGDPGAPRLIGFLSSGGPGAAITKGSIVTLKDAPRDETFRVLACDGVRAFILDRTKKNGRRSVAFNPESTTPTRFFH